MLWWCTKTPPENNPERKRYLESFYKAICGLPFSYMGRWSSGNQPHPKPFKREFLKAHGCTTTPNPQSVMTTIGLFLFSLGITMFLYWDFNLLMGWSEFQWPVCTIALTVIGFLMALKRLVQYAGDLSVKSYGLFDIWMIILFVCYSLGFAEITQSAKQRTLEDMSFFCQGMGSVGGLVSIIVSAVMFIPSLLWTMYNGWELYKCLNAYVFKNVYRL